MGRASILYNGNFIRVLGGAMAPVSDNFDTHSYESELEAMTDTAAGVRAEAAALRAAADAVALDGAGAPGARWLNVTDSLSGAQASQSFPCRSDGGKAACYRHRLLGGLGVLEASLEARVQIWVHSHGTEGGFALNEVADVLADAARRGQDIDPGVRMDPPHICAYLPEVKRGHVQWMLEALQVFCLQKLLARSRYTLRPEGAWKAFVDDPVRHGVLPSQAVHELLLDAQAPVSYTHLRAHET